MFLRTLQRCGHLFNLCSTRQSSFLTFHKSQNFYGNYWGKDNSLFGVLNSRLHLRNSNNWWYQQMRLPTLGLIARQELWQMRGRMDWERYCFNTGSWVESSVICLQKPYRGWKALCTNREGGAGFSLGLREVESVCVWAQVWAGDRPQASRVYLQQNIEAISNDRVLGTFPTVSQLLSSIPPREDQ